MKDYAWMCIQCYAEGNGSRDWLRDGNGNPISPYFEDLLELLNWMKANGWKLDEYGEHFFPWRCSRPKP